MVCAIFLRKVFSPNTPSSLPSAALTHWHSTRSFQKKMADYVSTNFTNDYEYSGISIALAVIDFLELCICSLLNTGTPAWQGWPPTSTSRAAVEANRGLLICWVLLRTSEAEAREFQRLPADEDEDDTKHDQRDVSAPQRLPLHQMSAYKDATWSQVRKAMCQVSETACIGYTEASGAAVFACVCDGRC